MINRFLVRILVCTWLLSPSAYAADFDFSYESRAGDFNGDGRRDIYLRYTPAVAPVALGDLTVPVALSKRQIGEFVLQQNGGGVFSVVSPLTGQQLAGVRTWPSIDITLVVGDLNTDGNRDLILTSVAAAISGAKDTVVFAPSPVGQPPTTTRAFDSSVIQFATDVDGRTENPGYFESGFVLSRSYTVTATIPAYLCSDGRLFGDTSVLAGAPDPVFGSPGSTVDIPENCPTYIGDQEFSGIPVNEYYFDETRFSAQALEFLRILAPYIDRNDGFTIPASTANAARDILSQVFGASFDSAKSPDDVGVAPERKAKTTRWTGFWRLLLKASRRCLPCLILYTTDLDDGTLFRYFIHYGQKKNEISIKMTGLWPPTFCTNEPVVSGSVAQQLYGLPPVDALDTPPDSYFGIYAPPTLPLVDNGPHGSAVLFNKFTGGNVFRTGGGHEFIFPTGVPANFVSGPFPLPPP